MTLPASVLAAIHDPAAPCPTLDDLIDAVDAEGGGIIVLLPSVYTGELLARAIGRLQAERDWPGDAATLNGVPTGEEIRRTVTPPAHVVGTVDLTSPKGRGTGSTACGEEITADTMMATSADAISCPTCAAAYVADPSLLGPVQIRGTLNGTPTGEEIQR